MPDIITDADGQVVRLTKEFSFEMAHALPGYDGACSEIHGHSYRLFVTVSGVPNNDPDDPKYGMVMDFRALKKVVNENVVNVYDHALLVRRTAVNGQLMSLLQEQYARVQAVDYQPTCENLIVRFARGIAAGLPAGVKLHSLKLHETASSFAEWFADDNR